MMIVKAEIEMQCRVDIEQVRVEGRKKGLLNGDGNSQLEW